MNRSDKITARRPLNLWLMAIKVIAISVIAEIAIMLFFLYFPYPDIGNIGMAVTDGLLLGLLIVPTFYYLLIQPVRRQTIIEQEDRLLLHDSLTGLPCGPLFHEVINHEIHEAIRDLSRISLIVIDPQGISDINQEMGFQVGDDVLVHIAKAIQGVCRDSDMIASLNESSVARLNGDRFAILAAHTDMAGSKVVEKKIRQAADTPFEVGGVTINIISTTGIAIYPDHADNAEELLRCANAALETAKQEQLSSVTYKEARSSAASRRIEISSRIRQAIATNRFTLFYQPKVSLETNRVCAVEALIRWLGEDGLSPAEFIPIAESQGLIGKITAWVIKEAVEQCKLWESDGIKINIAVNISARDLHDSQLIELLVDTCREHKLEPSSITIEVTESSVMAHPELAIERLQILRGAGFRISLDDFGTGYSSLSYLKNIPAHELKLDQSFVANICSDGRDERLVRGVIDLAHDLKLSTVAEGVETENVMLMLKGMNCEIVQGYFYSRPLDAASFKMWYRQRHND